MLLVLIVKGLVALGYLILFGSLAYLAWALLTLRTRRRRRRMRAKMASYYSDRGGT